MPASGFNGFECSVATFLEAQEQLFFWYRKEARFRQDYFVQGWQPYRIYADFIFTTEREAEEESQIDRVFVVETKGKHLAGVGGNSMQKASLPTPATSGMCLRYAPNWRRRSVGASWFRL